MSIEELARHMGMDTRVVRKWAEKGRLPGKKVGGEWRFNRARMLEWLQTEMHSFDPDDIRNLERAMFDGESDLLIASYLATEGVDMNLPARSRASVLRELVRLAERTGLVYDAAGIVAALEEREEMGPTALPRGIAFPHPRRPLPYATAEPLVCVARVPKGIPFGAPDGRLTDIFVLVCANGERLHLGLLARLAMMFNGDLAVALRNVDDADAALELILEMETTVIGRP
jgi:PTS system nitrogen regulatory IIA component